MLKNVLKKCWSMEEGWCNLCVWRCVCRFDLFLLHLPLFKLRVILVVKRRRWCAICVYGLVLLFLFLAFQLSHTRPSSRNLLYFKITPNIIHFLTLLYICNFFFNTLLFYYNYSKIHFLFSYPK